MLGVVEQLLVLGAKAELRSAVKRNSLLCAIENRNELIASSLIPCIVAAHALDAKYLYRRMLQHIAVCCSVVLQCVAVCHVTWVRRALLFAL